MTHRALRFSALTYTYYTCTNKHKGKGPHLSNSKGGSFVACTGCLRPPCTLPTAVVHAVGFPEYNLVSQILYVSTQMWEEFVQSKEIKG